MPDHRKAIRTCIQAFADTKLRAASLALLDTLGYRSDKIAEIEGSSPQAFLGYIEENNPDAAFNKDRALFSDWKSAELLFQLTDEELACKSTLFPNNEVNPGLLP